MKPRLERGIPLVVRRLAAAATILVLVVCAVWVLRVLGVPTTDKGKDYGTLAVWIAVALLVTRLFDYLFFDIAVRLRSRVAAPALLRQIVGLLVFGVCLAIVIKMVLPGFELGGLLVSSAILTAVIGLALQDTLGNLFAGLALHMEKTVQVGDLIRSGETFGVVEELSWRTIKLHTMEGNILLIPNSVAGRERLEIFPRVGPPVARLLRIGLEYESSPVSVREALENAMRGLPGLAAEPRPIAYLHSFDSNAVAYELRYWLEDFARHLEIDSAARERVWYALHRAGIKIAYPIVLQYQFAADVPGGPLRTEAIEDVLARIDLFGSLSAGERERLASGARERRYAPGEMIVREGDSTSSMFVIEAGRAAVSIHGPAGVSRSLATLEPGAALGEISLLTGEPRTATVRALTEVTAIEIDKRTLGPILEESPGLCESFDAVIADRRRKAAELANAPQEEDSRIEESPLSLRIARFFGLKVGE